MTLHKSLSLLVIAFGIALSSLAQPCLTGYTFTANPPPTNGTYSSGQTVTFCFTITGWNQTNANWFHGLVPIFGAGWDMSTLTPGTPPPSCSGNGYWAWYNSVQGTSFFTNVGPQGPGFFYNQNTPADNNPGNNFGDNCTGSANWQFCWTISVLSGSACVSGLNLGVTVNTFSDSQTGSWSGAGCTNDPLVPSAPSVTQCCDVDAGTNGNLTLCSTSPASPLFTALGGTPDAGGTWSTPGGTAHSGVFDPATDAGGAYTYTVNGTGSCSASAVVNVTLQQQPNAGSDGSITVCAGDPSFPLLGLLVGTPGSGGTWTTPSGAAFNGTFNPATSVPGVYTYTITGLAPCVNASAVVNVAVNPTPSAGTDGSISFCSTSGPASLFDALGGSPEPGGTWTSPSGGAFAGTYDPAIHTAGNYTYTVNGIAPCPNSTATVGVTENLQPDAGNSATGTYCATAAPISLFDLLGGTPASGGTWTTPSGGASNGTVNPANGASGAYTYTVNGVLPCLNAQSTVTLTLVPQPNAGTPGSINLCEGSAPVDLFSLLGGSPSIPGAWTGPSGASVPSTFDPATGTPGVYTYLVQATAPCVAVTSTVTVAVSAQPNAGSNATLNVCSNGDPVDLFTLLGPLARTGGNWTGPGGGAFSGTLTPGSSPSGVYTYTIPGVAPCITASATVTVSEVSASNPGTTGTANACTTSLPIDLFAALGGAPQTGGSWTTPTGAASTGILDPATASSGAYQYTLPANGPCPAANSVVNVGIVPPPNAGTNGIVQLCSSATAYNLMSGLGGAPDPGGSWTGPDGAIPGNTFVPTNGTSGTYTYTVSAPPPCTAASSTLQITVVPASSAGIDGTLSLCQTDAPVDPTTWPIGMPDPGGIWTAPNGTPVVLVDPATAASGNYTYTLPVNGPCPSVSSTLTLTIVVAPNAGIDSNVDLCSSAVTYTLLAGLAGSPAIGGTWTGPDGQTNPGSFAPGSSLPGAYTYTVSGTQPCASASSTLVVAVTQASNAGVGGNVNLCMNSPLVDPFTWLSASPDMNGSWSGPDGAFGGTVDPSSASSGNYTYTVPGTAPCPSVSAVVNLSIGDLPSAGSDGTLTLCEGAASVSLLTGLGGVPQSGGSWSGPSGASNGIFVPGANLPGTYTYTVNGVAPCLGTSDAASVQVSVNPDPVPLFAFSTAEGCAPLQVQFDLLDPLGIQSASWDFGDGGTSTAIGQAFHVFQNGGTYSVQVQVTDLNGCTGSMNAANAIFASNGPAAFFVPTPLTVSVENPVFDVTHVPQGGVVYAWTVDGQEIAGGSQFSHLVAPAVVGYHPICLVATDALGCSNEFCVDILVDDVLTIYVPNAFTPDGSGINDLFMPSVIGLDPDRYLFTIFDRWGREIFNTSDPNEGWNGAFRNSGEVLPQGVYVWRLFAKDQFSAERREIVGSVTLLK